MTEPVIRSIPLHRLEPSPANVRRTEAGKDAFAELKASIAALDVLENLVVRDIGPAEDPGTGPGQAPGERFAVIAGARRLAALNELASEGIIKANHPVPCRIVANGAVDGEISLAENTVRVAMHPADQVQAFGALALAGATVADIATRFGVSERIVEQRLRLGHAAPELLDAYRENAIDLETLKAFAVTTDRARQVAVWEQVKDQGYRPTGWQIKRMLTDDRIPAGAALARYVGVDAYEAAGGPVLRDLFADEYENGVWLEDPALLMQLAMDRLQVAADELATRWKWAEARLDVEWSDLARFGRVRPTPAEPTDEEKAEIERLHTRHDELVNLDEDAWTDELIEEAEAIEPRLEQIQDAVKARAVFKPEDIAIAGCIVTIGGNGELQLVQGLVKPEDMPADTDTATGTSEATAHHGGGQDYGQQATSGIRAPAISGPAMPPARPDPEAEARKEAGVGIGLADDLRAIRTAFVKARLAEDFGAAFDLALFQMGRAVFTPGYHDHALDIAVRETPDRPPLRVNDDAFGDWSPGEAMLADRSSLSFDWLEIEDRQESFAALRALPRRTSRTSSPPASPARSTASSRSRRMPGPSSRPPSPASTSSSRRTSGPPPRCSGRASARTGCWASPARSSAWSGRTPTARTRRPRWPARWRPRSPSPIPLRSVSPRRATPLRSPGRRPALPPSTQATSTTARPASRKRRLRTKRNPPHSRSPRPSSPSRPPTPKLPTAGRPIRAM